MDILVFCRLFDLGHRVVGVDCCRFPLENFLKDHSMEYKVEMKNGIPVYTVNHLSFQTFLIKRFSVQKEMR